MFGSLSSRVIVTATCAVAAVGAVDAARGRNGDLFVVFLIVTILQLVLLIRLQTGRREVTLRADLAAWVDDRAALTGEPAEQVVDQCVADQRAALRGSRE